MRRYAGRGIGAPASALDILSNQLLIAQNGGSLPAVATPLPFCMLAAADILRTCLAPCSCWRLWDAASAASLGCSLSWQHWQSCQSNGWWRRWCLMYWEASAAASSCRSYRQDVVTFVHSWCLLCCCIMQRTWACIKDWVSSAALIAAERDANLV